MKQAWVNEATLREIVRQIPTPFHLYSETGIRTAARTLSRAFSWNEGFREYFAVKALPNPAIMRILHEEGCGMDCASYCELLLAERAGVLGEEIMFSSNETPAYEYEAARRMGAIINLDDITHIPFLARHGGIPTTICCRYNPGGDFYLDNAIMGSPGDAKYGMTKAQLFEAYAALQAQGARRFGLHAFLSSNTTAGGYYPALAKALFTLAVEVKERLGIALSFINLSGGIGIPYRPEEQAPDLMAIGEGVRAAFAEILVPHGLQPALYTELGRWMTGPFGVLVTTVIHHKHIYREYVGVDACAANLMRPAMYGAYHHITVVGKEAAPHDTKVDVVGPLCENNDKFAVDRMLPRTAVGDLLLIHDTGAHGHAMGYNYNGKLRSAEVLLQTDGMPRLIPRAETPADYFATLELK